MIEKLRTRAIIRTRTWSTIDGRSSQSVTVKALFAPFTILTHSLVQTIALAWHFVTTRWVSIARARNTSSERVRWRYFASKTVRTAFAKLSRMTIGTRAFLYPQSRSHHRLTAAPRLERRFERDAVEKRIATESGFHFDSRQIREQALKFSRCELRSPAIRLFQFEFELATRLVCVVESWVGLERVIDGPVDVEAILFVFQDEVLTRQSGLTK